MEWTWTDFWGDKWLLRRGRHYVGAICGDDFIEDTEGSFTVSLAVADIETAITLLNWVKGGDLPDGAVRSGGEA